MTKQIIPLSVPCIKGNEWKYVKDCLDTGWVSSVGAYVSKFEDRVASYVGAKHAVACSSGTSALHLALLVAGVEPLSEVIVPALTFVAPANAIRYTGAVPLFMDVDFDTVQLDIRKLREFLVNECVIKNGKTINRKTKRPISAIVAVHLLGHPVDMKPLMALARKFKIPVVEDAAESIGAKYQDKFVGNLGDIACFSFNGNKVITCGGGGMIVTNNSLWAKRARYLSTQAKDDGAEYIHNEIGYNYRLTNIQAAVGLAQMEQLDGFIKAKRRIAKAYGAGFAKIKGLTLPKEDSKAFSTWWLYTILVDKDYGMTSRQLMKTLEEHGIQSRPLWHPLSGLKPFKDSCAYKIEAADKLYQCALSLPSSPGLSVKDQKKVIDLICKLGRVNGKVS